MQVSYIAAAARLSDEELLRQVDVLAARARETTVELVAHLAELDKRKLYLPLGYASLFAYCTGALRLAEHAAYNRIEAARICREFPIVLERLADGSVNLSTLRLVAPHLTPEDYRDVLQKAAGRSKREVEELVARLCPKEDAPVIIRKLPAQAPVRQVLPSPVEQPSPARPAVAADSQSVAPPEPSPLSRPGPRPAVTPLAPERYRLQFNVDRETQENLRRAQDLLRREIPDGDPGAIFKRALTLLLEDVARRKFAVTSRPRASRGTAPGSRDIPAKVMRAVWLRDGGRCAYIGKNGRRCGAETFLEFHHIDPHAFEGPPTVENISLRCRQHNAYEAELIFGPYPRTVQEGRAAYAVARPAVLFIRG